MKLPPLALVAPSLCPRCDQPAMVMNHSGEEQRCAHCGLQIHQCARCRGIAGPFDRYCGFCGFEMVQGEQRPLYYARLADTRTGGIVAAAAVTLDSLGSSLKFRVDSLVTLLTAPLPTTP